VTAPLFPSARTAAKLLDMKPDQFRALVEAGSLPSPCKVDGIERWDIEELKATLRGYKPKVSDGFTL
jgi:hypothetical protein